jgi:EAL domain-containing protein (putative c-di-GMP-specific phosphodiesterase class I)
MDESSENSEIIKTIVSLAGSLNLDVIAEGVETEGQLTQLRSLGCGYGQGFYFAPPLDGLAAEALIRFSRILSPLVEPKHTVAETNLIAERVPIQLKHVN